jgi:hypothetical protein
VKTVAAPQRSIRHAREKNGTTWTIVKDVRRATPVMHHKPTVGILEMAANETCQEVSRSLVEKSIEAMPTRFFDVPTGDREDCKTRRSAGD